MSAVLLSASRRITYDWVPSERLSLRPVTVTTWSAFQFSVVNVSVVPLSVLTLASVVSLTETGMSTWDEGWLVSFTVKVAVDPDSLTEPLAAETMKLAASSSIVDIATS